LTAHFRLQGRMDTHFCTHERVHLLGDNATYPIEPPWRALAALLLLARTRHDGPLVHVQLRFLGLFPSPVTLRRVFFSFGPPMTASSGARLPRYARSNGNFCSRWRNGCPPSKSAYTRPAKCKDARRVSLMRVCQPSPVARSAANTSASSRIFTGSLVARDLGRPRRNSFLPWYSSA